MLFLKQDATDRDDSSHSFGDKNNSNSNSFSYTAHSYNSQLNNSPPLSKRLEAGKKSVSSPSVSAAAIPQLIQESPSMGVINSKPTEVAQDNDITSELSETTTTTTTTTTSEDVVTTFKESQPQMNGGGSGASINSGCRDSGGGGSIGISGVEGCATDTSDYVAESEFIDEKEKSDASEPPSEKEVVNSISEEVDDDSALVLRPGHMRKAIKVDSSDVYQIVDILRRNTNLNFELACEALRVVLTSMEQLYNGEINPYLEAIAVHVTEKVETPKELLGMTNDSKRLQYIFTQIADCKNDSEQRTWMLYEDEDDITQFLDELVDILVSFLTVTT